jgi:hypothetical protein
LKNNIFKVLPEDDKFNIKRSLNLIALKLKSFEPIFSFNNLTYSDYYYKILANKKNPKIKDIEIEKKNKE